ncbi:chorismate mutase [Paenisporosarcina quisquiliarum]|uniref:chorismate mutase n=1 Tax=Paenisporosarcina quisquiliarum TaxID=365346 RepID=A0A9X3LDF9_9BACL|nr:chorismate mutase [Paenisporosarcina quisquiliarum]MCZ8535782.1 chorismate mutase [Paenisporosarcina quisquiliarum]
MIRGIRGATTVTEDSAAQVLAETEKLVLAMAKENDVKPEDVASVVVSTTTDIASAFPAKAVRSIPEWTYVPVMCTHEMDVPGAMPFCIRVLMHVNTEKSQREILHVYLNDAVKLRPDLLTNIK